MKRWNGTRMQIVIEIDEEDYKRGVAMADAIRNGIVLPKGHDRLVEMKAVIQALFNKQTMEDVPTIVEADEEG